MSKVVPSLMCLAPQLGRLDELGAGWASPSLHTAAPCGRLVFFNSMTASGLLDFLSELAFKESKTYRLFEEWVGLELAQGYFLHILLTKARHKASWIKLERNRPCLLMGRVACTDRKGRNR